MISRLISLAITLGIIGFVWNMIDPDSLHRFIANFLEAVQKTANGR